MAVNASSVHVEWQWKANLDPFAQDEKEQWRSYSEEDSALIEQAFRNNQSNVRLKNYNIDLDHYEQSAIDDRTRRRAIKRVVLDKESWLKRMEKLGEGSFGKVYEGTYRQTQHVAYKVTKGQLSLDAIHETNILKTLHHPSIVRYIDVIHTSQRTLLVMELIDGGTLCNYIESNYRQRDYWRDCENMMIDVAYAMSYLHEKNVVHADLKSDNVLLRRNGKAVLSDFGLSSIIESSDSDQGDSNTGALRWLAPELCFEPPQRSSLASDVWAYGCVILEITTSDLPWIKKYKRNKDLIKALPDQRNAIIFQEICREQEAPRKFIDILCTCCTWPKHNRPSFVRIIQDFHSISNDDFPPSKDSHEGHHEHSVVDRSSRFINASSANTRQAKNKESLYSADEDEDEHSNMKTPHFANFITERL